MKRSLAIFLFMASLFAGYSQTDTLFTQNRKKIPCKITEIGESDIRYKLPDNLDGPVYVISLNKVIKYSLSTGEEVQVTPDELLLENQHQAVMNNRSAIKIHPFSYVNNQVAVAYEQVIKMGTNLDIELGYINNNIMPNSATYEYRQKNGNPAQMQGFYMKPGFKFLIGQDFSLKGMKYAHPMKGRYILLQAVFSYLNYQDAYFAKTTTTQNGPPNYGYYYTSVVTNADVNCFAYGGMVNYGRQFLLGNAITLEYYFGAGATLQSTTYSNSQSQTYTGSGGYGYYPGYYESGNVSNYHGFIRTPKVGLSFAFGFRIGYLLPAKKPAYTPKKD